MSTISTETVLLADGEGIFGDLGEAYRAARGYRGRRARDGRRALEALREQRVLAVVASQELPGVDGVELAACAALLEQRPPVILVTRDPGVATWDDRQLEPLGLAEVVQRPTRLAKLVEAIERATGHRAPRPSVTARAVSKE